LHLTAFNSAAVSLITVSSAVLHLNIIIARSTFYMYRALMKRLDCISVSVKCCAEYLNEKIGNKIGLRIEEFAELSTCRCMSAKSSKIYNVM